MRLAGEELWSHTMVLFTCGDWLGDTTIEQHIESEGESLHWLIQKCGHRYHVLSNKNEGDDSQVTELLQKIEEMVVRNRGSHYEKRKQERSLRSFFRGEIQHVTVSALNKCKI